MNKVTCGSTPFIAERPIFLTWTLGLHSAGLVYPRLAFSSRN